MNDLIHAQLEKYPDQYLLAYIDVLGTNERISKYNLSSYVASTLYEIKEFFTEQQQKKDSPNNQENLEAFIFSDTLVFFIKVPENAINVYLFNFCDAILHTQSALFNMKIFSRGAITHGDFFIDTTRNIFFGPAFSRAYVLEQKFSKYPRIILDPSVFDKNNYSVNSILQTLPPEVQRQQQLELSNFWTNRIKVDVDNFAYIDYFTDDANITTSEKEIWNNYPFINPSDGITELSPTQLSIREKYSWVIDKLQQRETRLQPNHINSQQS
jgi:hypothetical protein